MKARELIGNWPRSDLYPLEWLKKTEAPLQDEEN
jgi:hypothetical protein